jgi:SurA-like N-terminal domain
MFSSPSCIKCHNALYRGVTCVLVPAVIIVAAVDYYKFFLPDGIAAVVNGENITTTELDAIAVRAPGIAETTYRRRRYDALNRLITETLAVQEAHKAGLRLSEEKIAAAAAKASDGLNASAFKQKLDLLYGGKKGDLKNIRTTASHDEVYSREDYSERVRSTDGAGRCDTS